MQIRFASRALSKYFVVLLVLSFTSSVFAHKPLVYLDQGWTKEQRQDFYETAQGSYLVPLSWFLSLEQVGAEEDHHGNYPLFSDHKNIRKFGYLVKRKQDGGMHDLPLGFAVESVENGDAWLGYTCAACHTNEIKYKGKTIRIDGAPTLADLDGFVSHLYATAIATVDDEERFNRFSERVLGSHDSAESLALYEALSAYADKAEAYSIRNHSNVKYGYGRLDGFGRIMNELFVDDLGVPESRFEPNAPVSYPFLWGTSDHDFVEWSGSTANPLIRNVGEVLGVFGGVNLQDFSALGQNTARVPELIKLENLVSILQPPQWPEAYFGEIDEQKAAQGRVLYEQVRGDEPSCVSCHALKDESGQYPLTPAEENFFGAQFVVTQMTPLDKIGTDPAMALNFATRVVSTGSLGPVLPAPFTGATELPAPLLLRIVTSLSVQTSLAALDPPLSEAETAAAIGYRLQADGSPYRPKNLLAYRARPLDGIWATAPYLHNGSVQNLHELLKPAHKRKTSFYVGSNKFDPKRVGFKSKHKGNHFLLDTTIAGNSNAGHEYGVYLSKKEKRALLEFLKTL
ncbi:FIG00961123: hypothetical protein [hydrothermal vent metagenome]|uniref:Cytochrome c domain-containing protein n=1 Tax=hydrothermal vent metagenome TaxID=652676 RepID=A0A3B1CN77_9ZZZZ